MSLLSGPGEMERERKKETPNLRVDPFCSGWDPRLEQNPCPNVYLFIFPSRIVEYARAQKKACPIDLTNTRNIAIN